MTEQVPVYQQYMNPILAALRGLGGSASIEALDSAVIENMTLPADVVSIPHTPDKPERSEVSYRMAWARTYLEYAGLITNPRRGVWALTEQGTMTDRVDEYALAARYVAQARAAAQEGPEDAADAEDSQSAVSTPLHETSQVA